MKTLTKLLVAVALVYSSTASAYFGIPMKHMRQVEQGIYNSIQKRLTQDGLGSYKIENFSVDWRQNSFKCVEAEQNEMNPDIQVGACVVSASANGIKAAAAVVKKDNGYAMTLLFLEIE